MERGVVNRDPDFLRQKNCVRGPQLVRLTVHHKRRDLTLTAAEMAGILSEQIVRTHFQSQKIGNHTKHARENNYV